MRTQAVIEGSPDKETSEMPPTKIQKTTKEQDAKQRLTAERGEFVAMFDDLVKDTLSSLPIANLDSSAKDRLHTLMHYTIPGGKLTRGLAVLETFRACISPREPTPTEVNHCRILGWCIEFLQAAFLVADDVMDKATMRRNKAAWYTLSNVGLHAVNDSFTLEGVVYHMLRRHFRPLPWYLDVLELFQQTVLQTEIGQMMDLTTEHQDSYDHFNHKLYSEIAINKTAHYSFGLPVLCGMHVAGCTNPPEVDAATEIATQLGKYFQMQDDFLDCYGDAASLGKEGSDIQERKCTWLFVVARERATEQQDAVLIEHYGREEKESVEAVKGVYKEVGLEAVFAEESAAQFTAISNLIRNSPPAVPKSVFKFLLQRIHGRRR